MYPPNPNQNLDGTLTPDQQAGRDFFFNPISDSGVITCQGCHILDRDGNREFGVQFPGFFGTDGRQATEVFPQLFKIPHLRNLYTKVGMFGFPVELSPLLEFAEPSRAQRGSDPRLRLLARGRHRHRVPLPARHELQPGLPRRPEPRRLPGLRRRRPAAPPGRAVLAGVPHQPHGDRRAADHHHRKQRRQRQCTAEPA